MSNPIRQLKNLPWTPLLGVSFLSLLLIFALDLLVFWGAIRIAPFRQTLELLLTPPLGLVTSTAIAAGIGVF